MRSGELSRRITIQQKNITINENAFEVEIWNDLKTIWASKRGLRGREYYTASTMKSENDVIFKGRYIEGITTDMRIVEDSHIYNIKSAIDTDGKKRELTITASEVVCGV